MSRSSRPRAALAGTLHAGLLAGLLGLALLTPARADAVLATVNGSPIRESDVTLALEDLASSLPQGATEAQKRTYVLDYLVDLKIVSDAAEKQKLAESGDFARKLAYARERLLMESLLGEEGRKAGSDEAVKKFYDEAVAKATPETEVRARHILTETEDAAKAALARVKAGEDFAKVASEISKDPGSGKDGGDLGYFTRDRMVSEFAEAAFKLETGQLSEPVKSDFGWHIIKVEDKRTRPFPELAAVREQIQRVLVERAQTEAIMKLRGEAKVERTAPPAAPGAAPAAPKP